MSDQAGGEVEILLVEDSPDDCELTIHTLRSNGLVNDIQIAPTGAAALEFLFGEGSYKGRDITQRPRMILLDLKLPLVSGVEVLRRIKGDDALRTIPVVILTSSREERDLKVCYELGANSYIVKPVDFDQFSEAIRRLGMYWLLLNEGPKGTMA